MRQILDRGSRISEIGSPGAFFFFNFPRSEIRDPSSLRRQIENRSVMQNLPRLKLKTATPPIFP